MQVWLQSEINKQVLCTASASDLCYAFAILNFSLQAQLHLYALPNRAPSSESVLARSMILVMAAE